MTIDRETLETLLDVCRADLESARLALADAERELAGVRDEIDGFERALESLDQRRALERDCFDRIVESRGTTIAEIQLFESRLDGFALDAKRLSEQRSAALARLEQAAAQAKRCRLGLGDRASEEQILAARLKKRDIERARHDEALEWDEREALAVRRRTEET